MSAIDNKHLIEIVGVNVHSGVSRTTGKPFELHKAQCVVRGPDDVVQIGEMFLSKEIAAAVKPGKYLAEFELGVSFSREVVPRITALHPHGVSRAAVAPAAAAAGGAGK